MSDKYLDPSGDTQAFRAFVEKQEPAVAPSSRPPLIIGAAAAAVVLVALVVWLAVA